MILSTLVFIGFLGDNGSVRSYNYTIYMVKGGECDARFPYTLCGFSFCWLWC